MYQEKRISIYQGVKDNTGESVYIKDIGYVGDPVIKKLIEQIRTETDSKKRDALKKKLPAVTWSGLFEKRNAKNLLQYSNLICIDIDKLAPETLVKLRQSLSRDKHVFRLFVSPSGNGLKVVFPVEGEADNHLDNFKMLEAYLLDRYQVTADPSGKDISRLCFLSYDEAAIQNDSPKILKYKRPEGFIPVPPVEAAPPAITPAATSPKPVKKPVKKPTGQNDISLEWIKSHTDKLYSFAPGSRSTYTYKFGLNAFRYGISLNDTLQFALNQFVDHSGEHPHTSEEVTATIKSAYNANPSEFGSLVKTPGSNSHSTNSSHSDIKISNDKTEVTFIEFWKTQTREGKNGQIFTNHTIDYNLLNDFLEANGFFRLRLKKGYMLIRFKDNICKPIELVHIKDFVFEYLKSQRLMEILNVLRRGSNKFFNVDLIQGLSYKEIKFNRSTADQSFFYFKNCIVKIEVGSLTTLAYKDLTGAIWESQIIQRDFVLSQIEFPVCPKTGYWDIKKFNCEMAQYIALVSHNPENTEVTPEMARDRFFSVCSSIGYMLHDHKNRLAKAIVAVDHKIPEDKTEQNGGTGKSIVSNSFKFLRNTYFVDGRTFDEKNQFKFTDLTLDHKIIAIQDCKHNLDFGDFFVPITQDFSYRAMYVGNVTIPFEDSAKFWFDSNFTFKGDGPSFRRRMHVIEFDDFFNDTNTPVDYFDHFLLDENDWSADEWNRFYNFYFYCVEMYLDQGLIAYPKSNYDSRRMLTECPIEFIDWIDAKDEKGNYINVKRNSAMTKKELLQSWNAEAKELNMNSATPHAFTKWVKKYCRTNKIKMESKKTNGKEYFTLYDANYTGEAASNTVLTIF